MESATRIYLGGTILTMNHVNSIEQAVAIKDEKIVAVGTEQDILKFIGQDTQVIDLGGKTLIPGFYDGHSHFYMAGETGVFQVDLNSPPIGEMLTINDYIAALEKKAKDTLPGKWVQGRGYDDTSVAEKRHPTRYDLDKVSTEHPIWLTHISYHFGVANSKALELAGITKDTVSQGGIIRKDPVTGEPNGVLEERAMEFVESKIPPLTDKEVQDAIFYAAKTYAQKGITTANDGSNNILTSRIVDYQKAITEGRLPVRVVIWFDHSQVAKAHNLQNKTNMITIGGVKVFEDGSIQGYTGYLSKPYHTPFNGQTNYCGYPRMDQEELTNIVKKAHNAGFQVFIHGNGDAAIDSILQAFSSAQREKPRDDTRHVVIHAQMAREDQLDLMKELGVIPSFYVLHTYYWGDRHRDIFIGPERAFRIDPCKSALNRNIPFTLHCDTPVVPQDPILLIWAAVNRVSTSGSVIGAEQRIEPIEALRACTINAAYQNFEENIKGSIEPGKLADFVILSKNPLAIEPKEIKNIQVLETIVGGRTVYKNEWNDKS